VYCAGALHLSQSVKSLDLGVMVESTEMIVNSKLQSITDDIDKESKPSFKHFQSPF